MKKLLLATSAIALAFGCASSFAADLGVRAPVYKAPPPPAVAIYNWTGCYVGGNVGGVWVHKDYALATTGADRGNHKADGGLGGVQAGCNYQLQGGFVIGLQGDYDWSNARGRHVDLGAPTVTDQSRTKSLSSVTGRIGYAWDRWLGYVKGGGAWERDDYIGFTTTTGVLVDSVNQTRNGWTVGVGGEYAFTPSLTGFIEYDHYDFGNKNAQFVTPAGTLSVLFNIKETKNVVKGGLNWKFY